MPSLDAAVTVVSSEDDYHTPPLRRPHRLRRDLWNDALRGVSGGRGGGG
ncbi:hypothetical protein ABZW02_28025 [Streptomyces sp. NPDC005180]